MHIIFFLRENIAKTTDYIRSQGFVVEQHEVVIKSFKTAIESLAMLVRIFLSEWSSRINLSLSLTWESMSNNDARTIK